MTLNKLFKSHMVFAANKPIRVFGTGNGIATVNFAGNTVSVQSENGKWLTELPPMEYGGPYEMKVVFDNETVILEDIYVGEVYLFAGQSNMQFKLEEATKPQKSYITESNVRFFVLDRLEEGDYYNSDHGWVVCDDNTSQKLSALGVLTSAEISAKKNIAVGGVCCYQGASVIESWLPEDALKNEGIIVPADKKTWSHTCEEYSAWNGEGCLYEFAFSKICPFSFSAVVWYQGESDSTPAEADVYARELATLIKIWRNDLKDDKLPFVVIQLADIDCEGINREGWSRMQRAQHEVCDICSSVQTVICRDICETFDIHPPTKDKLASRIVEVLTK